jgi:hypothetical protein
MSVITTVILSTNHNQHDASIIASLLQNPKEYSRCSNNDFVRIQDIHPQEHFLIDSQTYIGSFIYLDEEVFRKRLYSLPWKYLADVQVFVKTEHDDFYRELSRPSEFDQSPPLLYDPADGKPIKERFEDSNDSPITAQEYREYDWGGAWLYDPWTGKQRTSYEVKDDMFGRKIKPIG